MAKVSYKMRQVFYYKMRQLLQNACVDFISNFDSYYKMQILLQNVLAKHLPNEALFGSIHYVPIHCVEIVLDPLKLSEVFVSLFIVFSVILSTSSLSYVL